MRKFTSNTSPISTHTIIASDLTFSLYNYKKLNQTSGLTYDNLALVRAFAGSESE